MPWETLEVGSKFRAILHASNLPCPAIRLFSRSINTGTLNPKVCMLRAICLTCLSLCLRGLRRSTTIRPSITRSTDKFWLLDIDPHWRLLRAPGQNCRRGILSLAEASQSRRVDVPGHLKRYSRIDEGTAIDGSLGNRIRDALSCDPWDLFSALGLVLCQKDAYREAPKTAWPSISKGLPRYERRPR